MSLEIHRAKQDDVDLASASVSATVLSRKNEVEAKFELSQDDDVLSQEFSDGNDEAFLSPVDGGGGEEGQESRASSDFSHLVVFTAHKAGMDAAGLKRSKEDINRIIYENSKNSKFFKHALKQDEKLDRRIACLKRKLDGFRRRRRREKRPSEDLKIARMRQTLESRRRLDRIWCVVDMDMFFAAVEMRDDPSLKGKPFGVGGMGMISTANYEARKWGVRSAMPGFIAKKLCPSLLLVKPNFEKYKTVAKITREIFATYDPDFTSMSLDEASLDITAYVDREVSRSGEENRGTVANRVIQELRRRVRDGTKGCTASAGIAPNRMLAKIASDRNKPDGQCFVGFSAEGCINFLRATPLRKIPGIGKVTEKILAKCFGISTCGEIWEKPNISEEIRFLFRSDTSQWLLSASLGIASATRSDEHKRVVGPSRKGISQERTFSKTKSNRKELLECCRTISELLSAQMTRRRDDEEPLWARTLTLKLKTEAFRTITRSRTLSRYIQTGEDIYKEAKTLLLQAIPISIRLMGIRMSTFRGAAAPLPRGQTRLDAFVRKGGAAVAAAAAAPTPAVVDAKGTKKRASIIVLATKGKKKKKRSRLEQMLQKSVNWACETCTFENTNANFLACSVCRAPRAQE